ncbi:MAG: CotH kinase family protein [Planctomycetes bacterium]|nr:CotH kinase family protein [Planctomycetota bacterium]
MNYTDMKRNIARILTILSLIGLTVPLIGCGGQISGQAEEDSGPFYDDRVATVRIVMKEQDWTSCQNNSLAEEYVRADFWFDGELVPDVGVRPKGNSSLRSTAQSGSPRFSLKVDFNLLNRARGFRGLKKVNLNNGWSDPTLIRERLAYELFEQMDIPTPRTSFVDLWVNDTHLGLYTMVEQIDKTFLRRHFANDDGNLYKPEMSAGPLNWTEKDLEEQGDRRLTTRQESLDKGLDVNLGGGKLREIMQAVGQQASESQESPPPELRSMQAPGMPPPSMPPLMDLAIAAAKLGVTKQQLRDVLGEPSQGLPDLVAVAEQLGISEESLQEALGLPAKGMMPPEGVPGSQSGNLIELMGLKTNENNPDHSALFRFLDILNNEPDETFPEEIEKVLDVDEVLRFLAVSTLIVHLDNYIGSGHNYYLYEVDGKFTIIPWDLNMAFGTFDLGIGREGLINFYIDEPTAMSVANHPLVHRLLSHQPYLDTYHEYLEELLAGPFSLEAMEPRIDELAGLIRPYVEQEDLKFFSIEDFEHNLTEDVNLGSAEHRMPTPLGLKTFVVERSEAARQQLEGKRPSAGDGSGNGGGMGMIGRGEQQQRKPPPNK